MKKEEKELLSLTPILPDKEQDIKKPEKKKFRVPILQIIKHPSFYLWG